MIKTFSIFDYTSECTTSCNDSYSSSMKRIGVVQHIYQLEVLHDVKPDVPKEFNLNELMRYKYVDVAVEMYKSCAKKVEFDVLLNTIRKISDIIKHKYLVCSKMSKPPKKSKDMRDKRNTT